MSNYELYMNCINEICRYHPGSNIILIGDFNHPNIKWSRNPNDENIINPSSDSNSTFINDLSCLHFSQFNFNFNNKNKMLDLVFFTRNSVYLNISVIDSLIPLDPFHPDLNI